MKCNLETVLIFHGQMHTLANLQSITIVFLKIILTNVSAMINQANSQSAQNMRYVLDLVWNYCKI